MARRWRRPWIIKRKGKNGAAFQVVYYDAQRRRRAYDRSFRVERLAKEYARKLELYINGAGAQPDLETAPVEEKHEEPAVVQRSWEETTVTVHGGETGKNRANCDGFVAGTPEMGVKNGTSI